MQRRTCSRSSRASTCSVTSSKAGVRSSRAALCSRSDAAWAERTRSTALRWASISTQFIAEPRSVRKRAAVRHTSRSTSWATSSDWAGSRSTVRTSPRTGPHTASYRREKASWSPRATWASNCCRSGPAEAAPLMCTASFTRRSSMVRTGGMWVPGHYSEPWTARIGQLSAQLTNGGRTSGRTASPRPRGPSGHLPSSGLPPTVRAGNSPETENPRPSLTAGGSRGFSSRDEVRQSAPARPPPARSTPAWPPARSRRPGRAASNRRSTAARGALRGPSADGAGAPSHSPPHRARRR